MRAPQTAAKGHAAVDDPSPVLHVGPGELVVEQVWVGVNPDPRTGSPIAGAIAGEATIAATDVLRHDAIPATFGGVRSPSTPAPRAFDDGDVRRPEAALRPRGRRADLHLPGRRAAEPSTLQRVRRSLCLAAVGATAQARTRAVGTMASARHVVARGTTNRAESIQVAGRPTRFGRWINGSALSAGYRRS